MSFVVLRDWVTGAGFRAVVVKTSIGHNCGYVGVGKDHPLYGKDECVDYEFFDKIDVHGGVTYSATSVDYPVVSDLHWIGFDCGHLGDLPQVYDLTFCVAECEHLAEQLKTIKVE